MSNDVTDVGQLNGLFKEVYADKIEDLIPSVAKLQKEVAFNEKTMIGNAYNQPVRLTASQGVTYAPADAGAFALNQPVALTTKNAIVKGSQMLLRDRISYDAEAKSSHGSKKSFVESTRYVVDAMMDTMHKRVEISLFYGGDGIAVTASSANINATSTEVTISVASWAIGIWSGLENTQVNFYDAGVLVSSGVDSVFSVVSMDVAARTVVIAGTAAGITALDLVAGTNVDVFFNGSFGNEMTGLNGIITNTGTLFNIDAGAFDLWRGNVYNTTGALTLDKIYNAVSIGVGRGLDEDTCAYLSPDTWKDLASDVAAMRVVDSSYASAKVDVGHNEIVYHGQNGSIKIKSHTIIKAGDCFVVPPKRLKRIGASDIRFKPFAGAHDKFFLELPDNAGFELRAYCDQALFTSTPAKLIKITGFANL